ncbi:PIR Superfamily Protein [Plasmodium ovale wallikeri]|uniref:PIR Superfamily Protein n=1 Tax=Plasmodium ovale wallikeri TaxID=864142 RepID=A0A1A9ARM3_PLAOA|nr:PIR Superfamily Protein [Plasmodium ovale wallikeri]
MVISTDIEKFTYDDLEKPNELLKTTNFGKIFKEFNDENNFNRGDKEHCNQIKSDLSISYPYDDISYKFCNVLYKIVVTVRNIQNDYFNGIHKDDKMYCLSLKYWLYEQLGNSDTRGLNTNKYFQNVKESLEGKIKNRVSFPCTFNNLDIEEINKLRKIYAFALIYYSNLGSFQNRYIDCKYLDYLGKGLIEFYENISTCSKKLTQDNFCNELEEIQNIYMLDNLHLTNSKEDTDYQFGKDETVGCPLEIKSINKPFRLLYKEGKNRWLLTDESIASLNNSIISASSAIGATVGISSFLLYLFKFTNIRSLFSRSKEDNTTFLNIDEGMHDFTLPISEQEHNNFGNSEYKITYYSVDNS